MENLIESFYQAFQKRDAESMIASYHNDIRFQDPAFGKLEGVKAKCMWKMLCKNAKDLKIEYSDIKFDPEKNEGSAKWEAWYTFRKTGNKVHNKIQASFKFEDGLIIEHIDDFSLKNWASQAFGLTGKLFGGTSLFRKFLQKQTNEMLLKYMKTDI
ncbi:MAG: nuclear transport factor 2 family protein [Bacteroidota bacterium]